MWENQYNFSTENLHKTTSPTLLVVFENLLALFYVSTPVSLSARCRCQLTGVFVLTVKS